MIILLSPAKSLDFDSDAPTDRYTQIQFEKETAYLAGKLKKYSARKLRSMMDISSDLAELNVERYSKFTMPFTPENAKQAIFAFTGDVYQGLQAEKYSKQDLEFAQKHIRILSGLYGILRPLDLIQPYRLEMGTSWEITKKNKNLYHYWKKKLTAQLKKEISEMEAPFILNLASQEYSKALDLKSFSVPVISPDFKEEKGDKFQMISFFAKKARGLMASYAVKNEIRQPSELKGFDYEGYTFNEKLSNTDKNKWVFTRKSES